MMNLAALLLSSALSYAAPAPMACAFVPRAEVKQLFNKLPAEIVGFANCPGLRGVLMARFKKLDDKSLESFVGRYARLAVPDGRRTYVVKKMADASGQRQAVIETTRSAGSQPTWHYVFTARQDNGDVMLYIHSSDAKESRDKRESLQAARHELTKPRARI